MKVIPHYMNYSITRTGNVYSHITNKYLKPTLAKNKYLYVSLMKCDKRHYRPIHRLVLETFVGKCPEGMEACHNNSIRTDNRVENLRWDTRKNNALDAVYNGCCGENKWNSKLTREQVCSLRLEYSTKKFTQVELANKYNISVSHINGILHNRYWKEL